MITFIPVINLGGPSDNSESFDTVGWRCFADKNINCTFHLKIYLTGGVNVSEIVFYGYRTQTLILPPRINIVLYNITISPEVAMEITSSTYKVNIPIGEITDIIDIEMVVMKTRKLVLSEVEVISQGVNIGPLDIGYRYSIVNTTTPTTPTTITPTPTITTTTTTMGNSTSATSNNDNCNDTAIYVVLSLIIIVQFFLLLLLFTCCLYTTTKYRRIGKAYKLSIANQTRNESEYSKSPNRNESMYATIGMVDSNIIRSIATGERNVMTPSSPSQQEPLIPDSKLPKADGYQNEDSVAMVLSTSPYNITDNVLYAGNVTTQPPTVYDGISKFSQYAKTEHD